MNISASAASIGRFLQLRPAMSSRAITKVNAAGKARSTSIAECAPMKLEKRTAMRPASQSPASTASGAPRTAGRPVQLGIAVRRNPATVANAYPKIISCTCQATGGSALGRTTAPVYTHSQTGRAIAAHAEASRKNGRNPAEKMAGPAGFCAAAVTSWIVVKAMGRSFSSKM